MLKVNLEEVEKEIRTSKWFRFGKTQFECPSLTEGKMEFYAKNNTLPSPCDKCYKALIFWEGSYSEENVTNFLNMIDSFEVKYRGKLNKGVVVFYFRDKTKMLEFLEFLGKKMNVYKVKGKTQWRRACRDYQDLKKRIDAKERSTCEVCA